jgi:hypothetical protein
VLLTHINLGAVETKARYQRLPLWMSLDGASSEQATVPKGERVLLTQRLISIIEDAHLEHVLSESKTKKIIAIGHIPDLQGIQRADGELRLWWMSRSMAILRP